MVSKFFLITMLINGTCFAGDDDIASKSTCKITVYNIINKQKSHSGTGIVIAKHNDYILILTAFHVVNDSSFIVTSFLHGSYEAHVLSFNPHTDIAVLWIKTSDSGKFTVTPLSDTVPNKEQTFYSYQHPGGSLRQIKRTGKFSYLNIANIAAGPGSSGSGVCHKGELYAILIRSNWSDRTIFVSLPEIYSFLRYSAPPWAYGSKPLLPTNVVKPAVLTENEKTISKLEKLLKVLISAKKPVVIPPLKERLTSKAKSFVLGKLLERVGIPALDGLVIGSTGFAGIGLTLFWYLIKRRIRKRREKKSSSNTLDEDYEHVEKDLRGGDPESGGKFLPQLPPRKIDELNELLELGQLEGRDPYLDQAFGMFAEDELNSLIDKGNIEALALRDKIQSRINKVAPLSFNTENQE